MILLQLPQYYLMKSWSHIQPVNRLPGCTQLMEATSKLTWEAFSQVMILLELIDIFGRITNRLQKLFIKRNRCDERHNLNQYLSFRIFNFYVVNGNPELNFPQFTSFYARFTLFNVICKL